MRKSRIALLVVAAVVAVACAHPTEDPLPGETVATAAPTSSSPRPSTSTASGADQTDQVCEEAIARSREVEDEIRQKIADAQANPDTAAATLIAVRATATAWKKDLEDYAQQPIRAEVRDALNEGVDLIDGLLAMNPQELAANAEKAQQDLEGFLNHLETACA